MNQSTAGFTRIQGDRIEGLLALLTPGARHILYRFALGITRDASAAETIVQDSITRTIEKIDPERPEKFLKFLKMVVRNRALDWLKRWKRARTYLEATRGKTIRSAFEEVTSKESIMVFRRAVSRLSWRERRVIVLRVFYGMKYEDIGARIRTTPGNAKAIFFRAKAGLKGWLEYMKAV